jgi:hypothetical protein
VTEQSDTEPKIDLGEILAEMDELGRAKFDAALERVKSRKLAEVNQALQARIRELEGQAQLNGVATRMAAELAKHDRPAVDRG